MQNFHSELPKLDSLIAFEAAGRHESFTLAARELNLTQSAVSQRVRGLEDSLGITLFERRHRSITLTRDGAEYHTSVVIALNHLLATGDAIKGDNTQPRLRFATDVALGAYWLAPRLPTLLADFPGVMFDHVATDEADNLLSDSIDAAIIHGDGNWPGYHATLLFGEEVFPACSPAYLDRVGPVHSVEDFTQLDLIDVSYEKWAWMNWTIWMAEAGGSRAGLNRVFQSNVYDSMLAAARQGYGVMLGWRHFIDDALLDGSLVVPLTKSVRTSRGYYFVCRQRIAERSDISQLRDWIIGQIALQPLYDFDTPR